MGGLVVVGLAWLVVAPDSQSTPDGWYAPLTSIDIDIDRRNYRRFRVGKAHGATGERPQEMEGELEEEERDAVRTPRFYVSASGACVYGGAWRVVCVWVCFGEEGYGLT